MTSTRLQATARRKSRALPLRSWRTAVSLAALTGGAAAVAGCLMPWATVFAGLVAFPGTRGTNGKLLAAAGVLIAAAGIWHLVRGGPASRWVAGTAGAAVLGYAGYLLLRLAASLRQPGGDSMMLLRGGPGLWVVAAGGLLAFTTLFLPASSQTVLRTRSEDGSGLLRQAADRDSMGPRRWLQIALGLVWLLDAGLQYQPYMFTRGFVTRIVEPASMGNPGLISNSVMGSSQLMLSHIVIFNALFATIQLAIGLGLLWRQTSRAALACSTVWALGVWWLGEGLGGILTGSANPVTGAPGAALIYVIIAVLAWPPRPGAQTSRPGQRGITAGSIAAGSRIGLRSAQLTWAVLWASAAYFIVQAPNRAAGALHNTIAGLAGGEPGWVGAMDRGAASAIGSSSTAISIALATICLILAAGVYIPAAIRPVLILAALTALAFWTVGEDFGGMLTGQGTDPSTGPLLVLLAAAFWPLSRSSQVQRHDGPAQPAGTEHFESAGTPDAPSPATAGQGAR